MTEAMSRKEFNRATPYDAREKRGYVTVFACSLFLIALIPWYAIPTWGEQLDFGIRSIITICYFGFWIAIMIVTHSLTEEYRENRLNDLYRTHLAESD